MGAESLVDRMLATEGLVSHSIRTGQLTDEGGKNIPLLKGT